MESVCLKSSGDLRFSFIHSVPLKSYSYRSILLLRHGKWKQTKEYLFLILGVGGDADLVTGEDPRQGQGTPRHDNTPFFLHTSYHLIDSINIMRETPPPYLSHVQSSPMKILGWVPDMGLVKSFMEAQGPSSFPSRESDLEDILAWPITHCNAIRF
ncbi:hypothetical protein V6N12_044071 [Hibiscus sabdariffa]|uniref:Uncharacterized protein n=1 Tax=Hibiscus sabdariffa TaxID=183260 RepID=A0ABR2DG67_9ROSI